MAGPPEKLLEPSASKSRAVSVHDDSTPDSPRLLMPAHDFSLLSAIVQSTDDAIIGKSPGATITSWNSGAERLYGYTAEEAIGRHISLCVPPERLAETEDALNRVLRGERLAHYETVRERKSGERIDVSVRVSPVLDENGRIIGASSISRDITERKRAERRERAEHAVARIAAEAGSIEEAAPRLIRALCENLALDVIGLHVAEGEGPLVPVGVGKGGCGDDAVVALSSWPEEARRRGRTIWFSDNPSERAEPPPEVAVGLGLRSGFAVPTFQDDRCLAVVAFYARAPLASQPGLVPTLAAIAQIIGQLVRRSRAESELRAAVSRRDRFLAMLSHELRNPLAAVRAASVALQRSAATNPDQRAAHAVISRQVQHMSQLLDGLLDVARLTQDRLRLQPAEVDLESAITTAVEMVEPIARERAITLAADGPRERLVIRADRTRIAQLVSNLLSNAVKYSPAGSTVILSVSREETEAVLRVLDHGLGMSREVLGRIFDLFYQADDTLDRRESGMGVGLTLARTIAELHGGTLTASSEGPGCGSEFVVRLPLVQVADRSGSESTDVRPTRKSYRIVLVEDNDDNREMVRLLLGYEGHLVETAADGAGGLEVIGRMRPDVALVDIGLPGIDGFMLAQRVRANPALDGVSLIALSGYAQSSDVERAKAAGFDAHVAKPVTPDYLLRVVDEIVTSRDGKVPVRPPA